MNLLILINLVAIASAQTRPLGVYNVNRNAISVSGISSGAAMATQLHVAYSSVFMAVGMVAGPPYYCGENSALRSLRCMDTPSSISPAHLRSETLSWQSNNRIDPTSNMMGDRVYIFQGALDTAVVPGVGPRVREYYDYFVRSSDIRFVNNIQAEHGFPTMDTGTPCHLQGAEYINRCQYDGAYEILNHAYGGLTRPTGPVQLRGDFYEYDQREFFYLTLPSQSSMDRVGFVYVPSGCMGSATVCRLHIALHGCQQGRHAIGDFFATKTGYNEVGELNNIIILYPQATDSLAPYNPFGCWDWWGYNTRLYATRDGFQPLAIYRMVEKLANL